MNPTIIGFRFQRFPIKWVGRQVKAGAIIHHMLRDQAIDQVKATLSHTTVKVG